MQYSDQICKPTHDTPEPERQPAGDSTPTSAVGSEQAVQSREWYAVHVMAKYEQLVCSMLGSKGYETYSPTYRSRRQWSDRVKELQVPLFPGYVFCRFDPHDRRVPVVSTPGVLRIVGAGRTAIPIQEDEIAAIRAIITSGCALEPWPYIRAGCPVRIERGALAGVEGIVLNSEKKSRLIVSVHLLQRSVAVEMDRDWISPVTQGHDVRPHRLVP